MASGFGTTGQVGRCYPLWMDFSKCLQDAESRTACAALREDYIECLHHRKEVSASLCHFHQSQFSAKGHSCGNSLETCSVEWF